MAEETAAAGTQEPTAAAGTQAGAEAGQEAEAAPTSLVGRLAALFPGRTVRSAEVRREEADAARTAEAAAAQATAAAAADDAEDDDGEDDAPADQSGETKGRKRGKRRSERIKELQAEVTKRDLEVARLQGREEALRERGGKGAEDPAATAQAAAASAAAEDVEPQEDAFDTTRDYVKALARWEVKQEQREQEAKAAADQKRLTAEAELAKLQQSMDAHIAKGRARWDDFEVVALSPGVVYNATMAKRVARSEFGAELAYHLGRNLTEAARIARLEPLEAVAAIAKIESDIESGRIPFPTDNAQDGATTPQAGEEPGDAVPADGTRTEPAGDAANGAAAGEPAQAAAPRRTRAAAPLTPIRGGERPEPDLPTLAKKNTAEYMRIREKRHADYLLSKRS